MYVSHSPSIVCGGGLQAHARKGLHAWGGSVGHMQSVVHAWWGSAGHMHVRGACDLMRALPVCVVCVFAGWQRMRALTLTPGERIRIYSRRLSWRTTQTSRCGGTYPPSPPSFLVSSTLSRHGCGPPSPPAPPALAPLPPSGQYSEQAQPHLYRSPPPSPPTPPA